MAIRHTTRLDYSADVVEAVMDVRLGPHSDVHQRWDGFDLRVDPLASVRPYQDGFGNAASLITIAKPHHFVEVVTESEVQTLLDDPFVFPPVPARPLRPAELYDYLAPSPMIPRHPGLDQIAAPHRPSDPSETFEVVQQLMGAVYGGFTYKKEVTSVATTVDEVLSGRTGVCQDFAHVLIGLCRSIDIPARYVSGYIVSQGQSQRQSQGSQSQSQSQSQSRRGSVPDVGQGASHAWIEAHTPTHGWRGFDPTNNLVASAYHVKMAIGRDYGDVPPTRGTFRGSAEEHLTVDVTARPLD